MRKLLVAGLLAVVVSLSATMAAFAGDTLRLEADLAGSAIGDVAPSGDADWRMRDDGFKRLSVDVEDVDLPDDTVLDVMACGVSVGAIVLDGGEGELDLDERDGDTVPTCAEGDAVTVSFGETTVVSGTFMVKDMED